MTRLYQSPRPAVAFPGTITKMHGKSPEYSDYFPGILWVNLTLSMENPVHLSGQPGNSMEKPGTVPWTCWYGSVNILE